MPLNNSTNITFSPGNFTSSGPIGGTIAATSLGLGNVNNVKWANKTRQINLGNNNYGYVTLDISFTVTGGSIDAIGISFYNPDYLVTYSETLSGLFKPSLPGVYLKLKAGVTTRLYVVANSDSSGIITMYRGGFRLRMSHICQCQAKHGAVLTIVKQCTEFGLSR
jgi:hypothetical protein